MMSAGVPGTMVRIPFVAVAKNVDDKLSILHATLRKRVAERETVARLLRYAFANYSVWVVVGVVVIKELDLVSRPRKISSNGIAFRNMSI